MGWCLWDALHHRSLAILSSRPNILATLPPWLEGLALELWVGSVALLPDLPTSSWILSCGLKP